MVRTLLPILLLIPLVTGCGKSPRGRVSPVSDPPDRALVHGAALAADGTGDLFVAGDFTRYRDVPVGRLVRLKSDGSLDPGFRAGRPFESWSPAPSFLATSDGGVYVVGGFKGGIARLGRDGSLDAGFVTGTAFGPAPAIYDIASANDGTGDVYVAGNFTSYDGIPAPRLIRLGPDGRPRAGFSVDPFPAAVSTLVVTPDGKGVYCGGHFGKRITRLLPNGKQDPVFSVGTGFNEAVTYVTLAAGDLYVAGGFGVYNGTKVSGQVRLKPSGALDPTFLAPPIPLPFAVHFLVPMADGLLVGGTAFEIAPARWAHLVRLKWNGEEDGAFNAEFDREPRAVVPLTDGTERAYFVGGFISYQEEETRGIVRVQRNGTPDDAFQIGTGFRL